MADLSEGLTAFIMTLLFMIVTIFLKTDPSYVILYFVIMIFLKGQ